ncbi:MAG: ABC transporter permease [Actinomycetia bacterium]|nr:ABC transporter permease [Actinomycetes bacterium]
MQRMFENIKIAFQALALNKLRSFLTMLGIIIGVGAVVAMLSIGTGAQQMVLQNIQDIGSNLIIVSPGSQDNEGGFEQMLGTVAQDQLKIEDVDAIEQQSKHIEGAIPVILSSSVISYLGSNSSASIYASTAKALDIYNFEMEGGRFFNSSDVANSANVAVIGQTIIRDLFGKRNPIGEIIKIDKKNFTVIGTVKEMGSNQFGQDQDNVVSVPITTAQNKLYGMDYINLIMAQSKSEAVIDQASREVRTILRRTHNLMPDQENDFTVQNQTQMLDIVSTITNIFTITIAGIAGISLLVGGIGIMNIMLVSVTERTREIGIRKAVGAKNRDILIQFLIESIVLSVSGGIVGIAFAVLVSTIITRLTVLSTSITAYPIILAISFSMVVGLFFGIYPAMRAARLNPIDALRYE